MKQSGKWKIVMSTEMSMKRKPLLIQLFFVAAMISWISGCSTTPNNAPVVDRAIESVNPEITRSTLATSKPPVKPVADARASYVVKKGDTLFRIALDHGQSYSDIVAWNNLKNPNDIKIDQVLRVAPPEAAGGVSVQTASVNSGAGIEVRNLSAVNSANNKTGPLGDKRPYSEVNLAELKKNEPVSLAGAATIVKTETLTQKPLEKPLEKPAPQAAAEAESVDWIWPTEGKVVAGFDDAKNKGLDISGKLGQDVIAAGSGKVMYEGSGIRGYGNLVIIKHTNTLLSAYAHNKVNLVKEGQTINKGQKIAEMGNSDSDAIKLHFEIRQQGKPVDPSKFLPGRQ